MQAVPLRMRKPESTMEDVPLELVDYLVKSGLTYSEISIRLKRRYPSIRGLSSRSVRRFCKENGITRLCDNEIESLAVEAIMEVSEMCLIRNTSQQVGAVYGRRLMRGYLLSKGFRISEKKIASAMHSVDPVNYEHRRQNSHDRRNPVPYQALYYGHKIHIDQNEKLVSFGVTSVISRDGYSGKIITFAVMPVKNNIAIYDLIFRYTVFLILFCLLFTRPALVNVGLWDQVRVDHGREFYLLLFMQDYLRQSYGSPGVCSCVQTTSTQV